MINKTSPRSFKVAKTGISEFREIMDWIKQCENEAYPDDMKTNQRISDISDLEDYCESADVEIMVWDKGYMIYTPSCIVDFVAVRRMSYGLMMDIIRHIKKGIYTASVRKQMYFFLKILERRGKLKVMETGIISRWNGVGEEMSEVRVIFF